MTSIIKIATPRLAKLILTIVLTAFSCCSVAAAIQLQNDVVVCPALTSTKELPNFTSSVCETTNLTDINPSNRQIWVQATVVMTAALLEKNEPLGIFVSGKSSSEVYLNGIWVGQNGKPSVDKQSEISGKIDAVFFAPRKFLKLGDNKIVLKMSGYSSFLNLASPIQSIKLDTFGQPSDNLLRHYWKSLLPLGVLFLGVAYFGLAALRHKVHWLLPLMSLFATGQLFIEVTRALITYSYPLHDFRLLLILFFSFSFGSTMLAYTLSIVRIKRRAFAFFFGVVITSICVVLVSGFDYKSALSISLPIAFSLGIAIYGSFKKHPLAIELALILGLFFFAATFAPASFLDIYFFYITAALLVLLFIQQLSIFEKESQARAEEKERGDKLQLIVDQNRVNAEELTIRVNHGNKTELVNLQDIVYYKGAGDYVELALINGKTLLHSGNMADLELSLPSIFLRIHRSYIINTTLITSLERKNNGIGEITLRNKERVPVSRRVMPNVRERFDYYQI